MIKKNNNKNGKIIDLSKKLKNKSLKKKLDALNEVLFGNDFSFEEINFFIFVY